MSPSRFLRCIISCASPHKTTDPWTTAALLVTPSGLWDLPTTVVHGPPPQMTTKAPKLPRSADRPRLVSGLGPIGTFRPGPSFGFSPPCVLAASNQGHGHVASTLLSRGAARVPTPVLQPIVRGSPTGLVQTMTTEQWRLLKITKARWYSSDHGTDSRSHRRDSEEIQRVEAEIRDTEAKLRSL
jgi:hypothetical protein